MTRMAATRHQEWEIEGVLLMLGLVASVVLALSITRRAWTALDHRAADPESQRGDQISR